MLYYILECEGLKTMRYNVIDTTESPEDAYEATRRTLLKDFMSHRDFEELLPKIDESSRRDTEMMVRAIHRYNLEHGRFYGRDKEVPKDVNTSSGGE